MRRGVPARVVTGYQGGAFNPIGGYLIVRQSDAHAWSEIWAQRFRPPAAFGRLECSDRARRLAAAWAAGLGAPSRFRWRSWTCSAADAWTGGELGEIRDVYVDLRYGRRPTEAVLRRRKHLVNRLRP
jgi:hypothetical protein